MEKQKYSANQENEKNIKEFYDSLSNNLINYSYKSDLYDVVNYHLGDCTVVCTASSSREDLGNKQPISFLVYNEVSRQKIEEAKSLLENKTGLRLEEIK
jgi:hypothetical protein